MKAFLGTASPTASHLRNMPVEMKQNSSILNQIAHYWIPAPELFFGSLDYFLSLLPKVDKGVEAFEKVIKASLLDSTLQGNIENLLLSAMQEYQKKSQQVNFVFFS